MFAVTGAIYYFTSYVVENKMRNLMLFVVFYFVGAATHYYPIVLLPALFSGSLAAGISGKFSLKRSVIACVLSGMSLILLFPVFVSQYTRHVGSPAGLSALTGYIFSRSLLNIPDAFLQLSLGSHYQIHAHFTLARILLICALIVYTGAIAAFAFDIKRWLTDGKHAFLLITTVSVIALPFLTVPFAGALYVAKYLVPFTPLFFLLLASLLCSIKTPLLKYALFALLLFVFSSSTILYYRVLGPRPDFRDAVHFIAKNTGPQDTVVITPGYYFFIFDAYGPVRAKLLSVPQGNFVKDKSRSKDVITPESMETFARENLAGVNRVWVFYGDGSGLHERIPADMQRASYLWFEKRYKPVRDYNFYISPLMPSHKKPLGIVRLYEKKKI